MDKIMAFLMKWISGFMQWWKELTGLPTITYRMLAVNYSMVALILLVCFLMVLLLPGGLIF